MSGTRFEMFVHVHVFSLVMTYFFEAVHVELTDEGGKIPMFEVNGKNFLCEAGDALDGEGVPGRSP